ncbi:hypothetical protein DL96DRAFT_1639536 [Flagelloscypha sp. PMI_526]|nr:hypothetical protein DL96DRAFT_1639536 [Flagelloscypha sp. PMI_526]
MRSVHSLPFPPMSSAKSSSKDRATYDTLPIQEGFAFARIKGGVYLALFSRISKSGQYTAHIFRHELISIFLLDFIITDFYSTDSSVHILELIPAKFMCYEEENETVFLAKDMTLRLAKLADPMSSGRPGIPGLFDSPATRRVQY